MATLITLHSSKDPSIARGIKRPTPILYSVLDGVLCSAELHPSIKICTASLNMPGNEY